MSAVLTSVDPENLRMPLISGFSRRVGALPSLHAGAAVLAVLIGGLLLSIATTSDPLWWQLHFSQLGIFGDFSSALFNTTLKVSGSMVVALAFYVRRDVRRLSRGSVRRGSATLACVCLNVVGVNLALVGCVPLNTDKDLHDRVAALMVLGFLVLVASAPVMLRRLGARMTISTGIALVWLAASIALFVTATINLALFETISCSAMFAWTGMLAHTLGAAVRPAEHEAERGARRVVRRGFGPAEHEAERPPRHIARAADRPADNAMRGTDHVTRGTQRRTPQTFETRRRPAAARMPRRSNRLRLGAAAPTSASAHPTPPRGVAQGRDATGATRTRSGRAGAWLALTNGAGPARPPRRADRRRATADVPRRAAANGATVSARLRRRLTLRPRAVSAGRGTRDGSPDAHRRTPAQPRRRRRARLGAPVGARSLPR